MVSKQEWDAQAETKKSSRSWILAFIQITTIIKSRRQNPFTLDSKAPTADYKEYLMGEVRYSSLAEHSQKLLKNCLIKQN